MDPTSTELERKPTGSGLKRPLAVAVIFFGLFLSIAAQPAWDQDRSGADPPEGSDNPCPDIAETPLETRLQPAPANIMFIFDDSGSMDWEFMTPEVEGKFDDKFYLFDPLDDDLPVNKNNTLGYNGGKDRNKYRSQYYGYNKIYYNPAVAYEPWPNFDNADPDNPLRDPAKDNGEPDDRLSMSGFFYAVDENCEGVTEPVNIVNAHYYVVDTQETETSEDDIKYLVNLDDGIDIYLFRDDDDDDRVDCGELVDYNSDATGTSDWTPWPN